jgi:preprotein translocase subunit SecA
MLSLQDDLMRLFNAAAVDRIMTRLNIPDDTPIEHKWVTRAVANAQRQVESLNFDRRKNVLKYDDVMNEQRKVVYGQRQRLLEGDPEAVEELAQKYRERHDRGLVDEHCPPGVFPEEWDIDGLAARVEVIYDHDVRLLDDRSRVRRHRGARRALYKDALEPMSAAKTRLAAPRSCARLSVASCCRSSTASGASISTRWTRCATASACVPSVSATRSPSTSGRPTTRSSR